jgi:uncharacterized protein with GYD domain
VAKYIALAKFTPEGIRGIKDAPYRRASGKERAKQIGVELEQVYLAMGAYDLVIVFEAPDDETAAKFALGTGRSGFLTTQTLRVFDEAETDRLIGSLLD